MKNIPPSDMEQIQAKVAALGVLQGMRKDWGCSRNWGRNYLVSVRLQGWICLSLDDDTAVRRAVCH